MGSLLSCIGRGFSFCVVPAFVFWDSCGHRQVPALSFTHVAGLVLLVLSLAERPWGAGGSWYLAAGRATSVAAPPPAVNCFTPAGSLGPAAPGTWLRFSARSPCRAPLRQRHARGASVF